MKKAIFKKTPAFTMLELVFIIIIVGILAAVLIPRMGQSRLREAADQVVSHIRYTQHLAMMDDKYDTNDPDWFRKRWQIIFERPAITNNQWVYSVFSDNAGAVPIANADLSEIAINPQNHNKILSGGSSSIAWNHSRVTKELNLGRTYGITNIGFSPACQFAGSQRIIFDYMGRPLIGSPAGYNAPYVANRMLTAVCTITLTNNAGENINIAIQPETGYASVGPIF